MKNNLIILLISLILLSFAPTTAKENYTTQEELKKIAKDTQKCIDKNRLNDFKIDMNNLLDKLLNQKIVFDKKTSPEAIKDFYRKSKKSYKILKHDKNNLEEKQKLNFYFGVISAFPQDICDEFQKVINPKYNIDDYDNYVSSNLNCTNYYAKYFLIPYKIENTDKYLKFIEKLDFYHTKIYEMNKDLNLIVFN